MVLKATVPECLRWYGLIGEPYAISYLISYPIAQVIPRKPESGGQLRKQALLGSRRASETSGQEQAAEKTQRRERSWAMGRKSNVSPLLSCSIPFFDHISPSSASGRALLDIPAGGSALAKNVSLLCSLNTDLGAYPSRSFG